MQPGEITARETAVFELSCCLRSLCGSAVTLMAADSFMSHDRSISLRRNRPPDVPRLTLTIHPCSVADRPCVPIGALLAS